MVKMGQHNEVLYFPIYFVWWWEYFVWC